MYSYIHLSSSIFHLWLLIPSLPLTHDDTCTDLIEVGRELGIIMIGCCDRGHMIISHSQLSVALQQICTVSGSASLGVRHLQFVKETCSISMFAGFMEHGEYH